MHDPKDLAIVIVMLETIDKIRQYTAGISSCEDFERT